MGLSIGFYSNPLSLHKRSVELEKNNEESFTDSGLLYRLWAIGLVISGSWRKIRNMPTKQVEFDG